MKAPLTLALALVLAAPATAQEDAGLDSTFQQIVAMWEAGDAAGVADLAAGDGLSLELDGRPVGPLPARQAAAALRRLFEQRETLGVEAGMRGQMTGDPTHGFGEFDWVARLPGTTIPEHNTIFLALRRDADRWRITEIRVLR